MSVATSYKVMDRQTLAVATHRHVIDVSNLSDVGVQWVSHQAEGTATGVDVFGTLEPDESRLTDLDPSTNGLWYELSPNFDSAPDGSIKSQILSITGDTHAFLMFEIVVDVEIPEFSLIVRGKKR